MDLKLKGKIWHQEEQVLLIVLVRSIKGQGSVKQHRASGRRSVQFAGVLALGKRLLGCFVADS